MATITAKPFRLALLQLGPLGKVKQQNLETARKALVAAAQSTPKPSLLVLPEIWNSPYAVSSFREYSEPVPDVGAVAENEGETVKFLRQMAKETGCWLIGGGFGDNGLELRSDTQDLSLKLRHRRTRSSTRRPRTTQRVSGGAHVASEANALRFG
jgi:predicted amidohydrolase